MEIREFKVTDEIVGAFNEGFSDYIVPIPHMDKKGFTNKMIFSNYTSYDCSSICTYNEQVVGVLLAGQNENVFMISAFCVIPEFRGKGVAKLLIDDAIKRVNGKKIALEVISENHRAIKFYEKMNFKKAGDISFINGRIKSAINNDNIVIRELSVYEILQYQGLIDVPLNWQSTIQCVLRQKFEGKGCFINDELVGFIIYTNYNIVNIKQLYVIKEKRHNGIGFNLIYNVCGNQNFSFIFRESDENRRFFESIGIKEKIHLYQMEYNLNYLKSI